MRDVVEALTARQTHAVQRMLDEEFGAWAPPVTCSSGDRVCLVVASGDKTVGATTATLHDGTEYATKLDRTRRLATPYVPASTIAVLDHVTVLPEYRCQGLGQRLIEAAMAWAAGKHAEDILAWSWRRDGATPADKPLRMAGLAPRITIADFWRDEGLERQIPCRACGRECHCSATLFSGHSRARNAAHGDVAPA